MGIIKKIMKSLTPNLIVHDVNQTVNFYSNVLGFELKMSVPETGRYEWAMMSEGDALIMFQEAASLKKEYPEFDDTTVGGGATLYIKVDDVDGLLEKINHKAEIIKEKHVTFYGSKEFAIKDNNGYILVFAQS